ncbi:MAG: M23 family metallopeptidase [Eubacteriales bacterium]
MDTKEKNTAKTQASRILYMVVAAVLCIGAVAAGVAASLGLFAPGDPGTGDVANTTREVPVDTDALPSFIAPAGGVVYKEHDLSVLVFSNTLNHWRVHQGIDIGTADGAGVRAAADGVVSKIYDDPMLGVTVEISHNGNALTRYCNLKDQLASGVTVGATVSAGQVIGSVGETALSEMADEPHLHFELHIAGKAVDPLAYITEESQAASLTVDTAYEG